MCLAFGKLLEIIFAFMYSPAAVRIRWLNDVYITKGLTPKIIQHNVLVFNT